MKRLKRKLAIVLAMIMVLTNAIPVFADNDIEPQVEIETIQEEENVEIESTDLEYEEIEKAEIPEIAEEEVGGAISKEETEPEEEIIIEEVVKEELSEEEIEEAFYDEETVDGVVITVTAEPGVIKPGTELWADRVKNTEVEEAIEEVVEDKREDNAQVIENYKFDIKLYLDGEEVEPNGKVTVSFALAKAAANADVNVYHIKEDENTEEIKEAEILESSVIEETEDEETPLVVEAESESFSYYVVEFTVGELQYVLNGDGSVKLSVILEELELEGIVTAAEVSNDKLFTVTKDAEGDDWTVTALQAFSTEEWMKVTIDGKEYTIIVTDTGEFTTWEEFRQALLNAEDGATLKLTQNLTAGEEDYNLQNPLGKTVTIDLNGCTLDRNSGAPALDDWRDTPVINMPYNYDKESRLPSTLIIVDSSVGQTGKITGGKSTHYGGGISVNDSIQTLIIHGGNITGNVCSNLPEEAGNPYGSGIGVNHGTLIMDGGSVTGNTIICKDGEVVLGGAVVASKDGESSMIVGGNTVIKDNVWKNESGSTIISSDLRINTGKKLTIGNGDNGCPAPENGMEIGAFLCDSQKVVTGAFTTNGSSDYVKYFFADYSDQYVKFETDHLELAEIPEDSYKINIGSFENGSVTSDKQYAKQGNTVTLTVSPDTGYHLKADTLKVTYNDGSTQTITPTKDATDDTKYTFNMPAYGVTVTAEFEEKALTPVDVPTAATGLTYTGKELTGVAEAAGYTVTNGKATKAGDYTATATLSEGYKWSDGSRDAKQIKWSIAKAALTAKADDKTVTYGDAAPTYTVKYDGWKNGAEEATTAAELMSTYTTETPVCTLPITFKTAPVFANYAVTTASGTLTVVKAENSWKKEPSIADVTYGTAISPVGEAAFGTVVITYVGVEGTSYESSTNAPTKAGKYKATFAVTGTADYSSLTKDVTFTIGKKQLTVTGTTVEETRVYDGTKVAKVTAEGSLTNAVEGDDITLGATAAFADANAGENKKVTVTYTITGDDAGNYIAPVNNTSLTASITKANVPAPLLKDSVTIDYKAETIAPKDGHELSLGSGEAFEKGKITVETAIDFTRSYYIRKAEDENHFASAELTYTPAHPAAPSGFTAKEESIENKKDGTFSGITSAMEYQKNGGEWISGPGTLSGLSDETINVRTKATDEAFKSLNYTYTFTASTGRLTVTMGEVIEKVPYDGLVTKPADPVREGFAFGGWYTEEACITAWNFAVDTVTDNMTLYPKWIKNEEKKAVIGGNVTEDGVKVPQATVELFLGTEKIAATVTDNDGNYKFDNVKLGTYNIVVTKADGSKTKTELVTVNRTGEFSADVKLPKGDVNSVVEHKEGDVVPKAKSDISKTVVGGLDEIAEEQTPEGSDRITIKLTVEPKKDEETPAQQKIKKEAGEGKKVEFLDLSLVRQVNDGKEEDIGGRNTKLLTIVIPFDFEGVNVSGMMILRNHGGKTSKLTKTPNSEGEYFTVNRSAGTITIYAKKFSDYAIAYSEATTPDPSGGGSGERNITAYAEPVVNATAVSGTWVYKEAEDTWYYTADGSSLKNGWYYLGNPYSKTEKTGWFCFDEAGRMQRGWILSKLGHWFFTHDIKDGDLGRLEKGWHKDEQDGLSYYLDLQTGRMYTGWHTFSGVWYYFTETSEKTTWRQDEKGRWVATAAVGKPLGSLDPAAKK